MVSSRPRLRISSSDLSSRRNGLPVELWRVVMSYLSALDLCRCSQVCKEWKELVESLDSTRWKDLYFEEKPWGHWKHPLWPNDTSEPESWKAAYKKHHLSSKLWLYDGVTTSCFSSPFFKRKRERGTLKVGFGKGILTLKSALTLAAPFDRIWLYPGTYQEDTVVTIKCPVSIVGIGDSSKIVITASLDMQAATAKIENVTVKPSFPRSRGRSSALLVKATFGYLQLEHCTLESGFVQVVAPGSVNVHSCTFNSAFVSLKGVGFSSIKNCLFKPERFAVFVEEAPFHVRVRQVTSDVGGWVAASNEPQFEEYYAKHIKLACQKRVTKEELCPDMIQREFGSRVTDSDFSDTDTEGLDAKLRSSGSQQTKQKRLSASSKTKSESKTGCQSALDEQAKFFLRNVQGPVIRNIKVTGGRGGVTVCRLGQVWVENSELHNLVYGVRCLQSAKLVLLNNKIHSCETSGVFIREHASGLLAGNQIFSNGEAGIDIRSSADPIIQHNQIHSGRRSGVVVLDNGKGLIRENDIYNNKEAGVYILYKGNPKVRHNRIWSGRAAGIAVTEEGCGHISHNDICGMEWAGIDIRHGGNPVVSHNVIRKGQADGIVIGEGGKSVLLDNDIEGNSGCGVWVLDGSHPLIHSNRVSGCGDSGIAFVNNSDNEHEHQQLNLQFLEQEQQIFNNEMNDGGESSEEEEFVPPPQADEEPESRFVHVSRPEKKLAQVEGNIIENNKCHGILYNGTEGVVIMKNKLNRNGKHGISLSHPSEISVTDNSIRQSNLCGINIELGVCAVVTGNGIYDNGEYGIATSGTGTVKQNDIFGHQLPSILIRSHADPHVLMNRLHAWKHECVYVEKDARGVLEKNEFYLGQNAKDISLHPNSNALVQTDNMTYEVTDTCTPDELSSCEDLQLTSDNVVSSIDAPRPLPATVLEKEKSAPFFTTHQPVTVRHRSVVSNICTIL